MHRFAVRLPIVGLLLALCAPTTAHAQFGDLAKLIDNFTDLSFFAAGDWHTQRDRSFIPYRGAPRSAAEGTFGSEFLWEVRRVPFGKSARKDAMDAIKAGSPCQAFDSTKPTEVHIKRVGGASETTWVYAGMPCTLPAPTKDRWLVEMGLAYTQSNRMIGNDGLSGIIRQLPRVGLYLSRLYGRKTPEKGIVFAPYGGVNVGISKLDRMRITGTDSSIITGTADAISAGFTLGFNVTEVSGQTLPFKFFMQWSIESSSYPAIDWSSTTKLPPGTPDRIDIQRASMAVGLRLKLKEKK